MDTVRLYIQMEKADAALLKKILQNIKGVIKVEEEKDPVLNHLNHLKDTATSSNTVSLEQFNQEFDDHLCELYSEKFRSKKFGASWQTGGREKSWKF